MKRWKIWGLALGTLLAGAWLALAATPPKTQPKTPAKTQSKSGGVDFWSSFKSVFMAPEPEYKDQGPGRTTVSGVRGVDQEAKLGEKYDWNAVRQMEKFLVTEAQMMSFLQEGKVGPFFEKKGGGQ